MFKVLLTFAFLIPTIVYASSLRDDGFDAGMAAARNVREKHGTLKIACGVTNTVESDLARFSDPHWVGFDKVFGPAGRPHIPRDFNCYCCYEKIAGALPGQVDLFTTDGYVGLGKYRWTSGHFRSIHTMLAPGGEMVIDGETFSTMSAGFNCETAILNPSKIDVPGVMRDVFVETLQSIFSSVQCYEGVKLDIPEGAYCIHAGPKMGDVWHFKK